MIEKSVALQLQQSTLLFFANPECEQDYTLELIPPPRLAGCPTSPASDVIITVIQRSPDQALRATLATREMDEKELRRSHFALFFRRLICPSGCVREFLSSPHAKNISLNPSGKSLL
jgi:hypothetical protein